MAADGRVLLGGRVPEPAELPPELAKALQEWAEVAATVARLGAPADRELVRQRGRQLAVRLASHRGVAVEYVDPVSGAIEPVPFVRQPQPYPRTEPSPYTRPRPTPAAATEPRGGAHVEPTAEPTPWATGLTITATFAIVVAIADITLSRAFADAFGLLWLPANVLVGAGIAPALWLARKTPFWRWLAYGVAAGMVVAWTGLLFGLLG
jgi:hypothetical protein